MKGDGSSNEERPKAGRKYRTDRTEGISDGVFAVSLTLLILDVRPPEGGVSQLVHGLVLIAPRLGTFALSFAIVGKRSINCVLSGGPRGPLSSAISVRLDDDSAKAKLNVRSVPNCD
jgi:hypothetical protein